MTDQWVNRKEIHSETSDRVYTFAQRAGDAGPSGAWHCSCPIFKSHRQIGADGRTSCKHLRGAGLKGPIQVMHGNALRAHSGANAASFAESAYEHYDPSVSGYGSAQDWADVAAGFGQHYGHRKAYQDDQWSGRQQQSRRSSSHGYQSGYNQRRTTSYGPKTGLSDLDLMGLRKLPDTAAELTAQMRRRAFELHPDTGGATADVKMFTAMFDAYKRLLQANYHESRKAA